MAKIETTAFDSADYLKTAEDVAAYLDTYLADGTLEELRRALATIARTRATTARSQRSAMGCPALHETLAQDGDLSLQSMRIILAAIGLRLTVAPTDRNVEPA